jgi:hypothetical protein
MGAGEIDPLDLSLLHNSLNSPLQPHHLLFLPLRFGLVDMEHRRLSLQTHRDTARFAFSTAEYQPFATLAHWLARRDVGR